jgi:trimethylamine--corrinoid protein Co-methyltransferase
MSGINEIPAKVGASAARRKAGGRRRAPPQPRRKAATRFSGGRFTPLNHADLERIHTAALEILDTVGMSDVPSNVQDVVINGGGKLTDGGRLCFPTELVQRALYGLQREIVLCGQSPEHDMHLRGSEVYTGSGGAAPLIVDIDSGEYRESTLCDLYDAARLVDSLENVHFFSRSMVARDMENPLSLDINTAYVCLAGTTKHVMVSASNASSVSAIAQMCYHVAGSREAFVARPFLSLNINHAVSPLRFDGDACAVLAEAVRYGIPAHVNTFSQLGASSPVTIAGTVAQTMAETLAGMVFAWLLDPNVKAIFGPRPMVTDLRTGSMAGGAGEQAMLTAVSVQMSRYYGFSNSTIAGATDSKLADAQSGYEKCLSVSFAAQTGANLITQACGMQAGLMACSLESYVVDNEMLGPILRSLAPVEVSDETLSVKLVSEVVLGDGHYLGHADTLKRMQSDFLYPSIADRRDHAVWAADGSLDIRSVAKKHTRTLLATHFPSHIDAVTDAGLRIEHDIRIPTERMQPA